MKKVFLLTITTLLAGYGIASAQPFTPAINADLYGIAQGGVNNGIPTPREDPDGSLDVHDAINLILGTSYAHNNDIDHLYFGADPVWFRGNDSDALVILIGGSAARSNALRVYDTSAPGVKIPVIAFGPIFGYTGDGLSSSTPFVAKQNNLAAGTQFGWSLLTVGEGVNDVWDSNPVNNVDGLDHLLAYKLADLTGQSRYVDLDGTITQYTFENPFLLSWEDKRLNNGVLGDEDYNDLMYLVTRVVPLTPNVIPEPLSLSLIGGGFLGMVGFRRKRRV